MTRLSATPLILSILLALAGCGEGGDGTYEVDARLTAPVSCPGDAPGELAFAEELVSFEPGEGAGFGQDQLPQVVLGPPVGSESLNGSLDVVSLGDGGSIVVKLSSDVVDCEGPDLAVFENAFDFGSVTFVELGEVSVSLDGRRWFTFPCDPESEWPHPGCGGVAAVPVDAVPSDPLRSGGDHFDLADLGITRARYVRVVDLGVSNGPVGPPTRGYDLDAVAIFDGHANLGTSDE